jgi:hypothetical protein
VRPLGAQSRQFTVCWYASSTVAKTGRPPTGVDDAEGPVDGVSAGTLAVALGSAVADGVEGGDVGVGDALMGVGVGSGAVVDVVACGADVWLGDAGTEMVTQPWMTTSAAAAATRGRVRFTARSYVESLSGN